MFFLGTSVYLLPVPLVGFVKTKKYLLVVGKVIAILVAIYYLYVGFSILTNG
jgi:hypothetical protein